MFQTLSEDGTEYSSSKSLRAQHMLLWWQHSAAHMRSPRQLHAIISKMIGHSATKALEHCSPGNGVCVCAYIYTVYTYIYTHTHIPTFSRFMGKLMIIHWITLLLDKPQSMFIPPKFWTRFDLELVHTSGWTQVWCRRSARRRGSTRRVSCTAAQYNYTVDHKLVLTWRC